MTSRYPTNLAYADPVSSRITRYLSAQDFRARVAIPYNSVANVNQRLAQRFATQALRSLAFFGRVIPWVSLGLTAFEIYQYFYGRHDDDIVQNYDIGRGLDAPNQYRVDTYVAEGWEYSGGQPYLAPALPPGNYQWTHASGPFSADYLAAGYYMGINSPPALHTGEDYYQAPVSYDTLIDGYGNPYAYRAYYGWGYIGTDPPQYLGRSSYASFTWPFADPPPYPPTSHLVPLEQLGFPPNPDLRPSLPVPASSPAPLHWTLDPLMRPPSAAPAVPRSVPYRLIPLLRINPWRAPEYQRNASYDVPRPVAPRRPVASLPLVSPTVAISATPEQAARARPLSSYHSLVPPRGGDKERKMRISGVGAMLTVVNHVTEAVDTLHAVYYALPRKYWEYRPTPQRMLYMIYLHADELSLNRVAWNLAIEKISDIVYGSLSSGALDLSRKYRPHGRLPIGYQSGPAL